MGNFERKLKHIVAAFCVIVMYSIPLSAQSADLDELFGQLAEASEQNWQSIENRIWAEWSKSGSSTVNLLLKQGHAAMKAGDLPTAIEHFTAVTDHAPDFAEGWNSRATAYYHAGKFGPSIEDIRRTLDLNPRHFGALAGLGMIFEQIGYPKDALVAYERVQAIHPHSPNIKDIIKRLNREIGGSDI